MVEVKKLKIATKKYHFEIKKRFEHAQRYKMRERSKLQDLTGYFKKMGRKEIKKSEKDRTGAMGIPISAKKEQPQKKGFNPFILIVAIFLAIILVAGGWFYFSLRQVQNLSALPQNDTSPIFTTELLKNGIVTAGDRRSDENVGFVRLKVKTGNVKNYSVLLTTYTEVIPSEIFILNSERVQADGYLDFITELKENLKKKSIRLNEIEINQIEKISRPAIIIVPSGRIPQEFLGINSKTDLTKLIDKNVVVIYIGLPFDRILQGSVEVPAPPNSSKWITFDQNVKIEKSPSFNIFQPLYHAQSPIFDNKILYGAVSVIKKGGGAFVILPQTLDGGWVDANNNRDPKLAAKDLSKIIFETAWLESEKHSFLPNQPSVVFINATNTTTAVSDFFTRPFRGKERYLKVEIAADTKNETLDEMRIANIVQESSGSLYIEEGYTVVPTDITERLIRMNVHLKEKRPEEKFLFLAIRKNGQLTGEKIELARGAVSTATQVSFDVPLHLDTGDYIAQIVDEDDKIYAETYLKAVFLDIIHTGQKKRNSYSFLIKKEGQPFQVKNVQLSIDNGKYGNFSFEKISDIDVDITKETANEDLPFGTHIFAFRIGKIEKKITINKPAPQLPLPTEFLVIIALALLIVAVGIFFAKQEVVTYQIDIPDFPPLSKIKIPFRKENILLLFDQINNDYRWKYSPLTLAEIKNGFKKITYQGKGILISDYNLEYLLEKIIISKDVLKVLDYYGLKVWEEKAKKSLNYLAAFRRLRDICVNNATPFTALDESQDCDSIITSTGQEMFVHLYDKNTDVSKLVADTLKTIRKGITILLFINEDDKKDMEDILRSSGEALITLKLEVESGAVMLLTTDEFDKMLQELKGI